MPDVSVHDFITRSSEQRNRLSAEKKDELARAYLEHVLCLTSHTIEEFLKDNPLAKCAVTIQHLSGQEPPQVMRREGYQAFSALVEKLMPGVYTPQQIELLRGESAPDAAHILLVSLYSPLSDAPVLNKIRNAAYEQKQHSP